MPEIVNIVSAGAAADDESSDASSGEGELVVGDGRIYMLLRTNAPDRRHRFRAIGPGGNGAERGHGDSGQAHVFVGTWDAGPPSHSEESQSRRRCTVSACKKRKKPQPPCCALA